MLWGKECSVHMGACFSGGSRLAPAEGASGQQSGIGQPPAATPTRPSPGDVARANPAHAGIA